MAKKKQKKTKLKVGTELVHKKSGNTLRVAEIEFTVVGRLPNDSMDRAMHMNKKELLYYFDIKADTIEDEEDIFS